MSDSLFHAHLRTCSCVFSHDHFCCFREACTLAHPHFFFASSLDHYFVSKTHFPICKTTTFPRSTCLHCGRLLVPELPSRKPPVGQAPHQALHQANPVSILPGSPVPAEWCPFYRFLKIEFLKGYVFCQE